MSLHIGHIRDRALHGPRSLGFRDPKAPPRLDLPEIKHALEAGDNRDVAARELPGLNHMFQTYATGAMSESATIEETFAPAALDTITTWIRAHTRLAERRS